MAIIIGIASGVALFFALRSMQKHHLATVVASLGRKLDDYLAAQASSGMLQRIGFDLTDAAIVTERVDRIKRGRLTAHLTRIYKTRADLYFWCFCEEESIPVIRPVGADQAAQVIRFNPPLKQRVE